MERGPEVLDRHKLVLVFDLVDKLNDGGIVRSGRAGALPLTVYHNFVVQR